MKQQHCKTAFPHTTHVLSILWTPLWNAIPRDWLRIPKHCSSKFWALNLSEESLSRSCCAALFRLQIQNIGTTSESGQWLLTCCQFGEPHCGRQSPENCFEGHGIARPDSGQWICPRNPFLAHAELPDISYWKPFLELITCTFIFLKTEAMSEHYWMVEHFRSKTDVQLTCFISTRVFF